MKIILIFLIKLCTGREIRTPINGFGDRYSTIELCPYIKHKAHSTVYLQENG